MLRRSAKFILALACLLLLAGIADLALAQGSPFGVGRPPSAPPAPPPAAEGLTGWLLAKQAEFYRALSGLVRAAKAEGSAVWALLGLSFLYGVFHAAGPGHGKAVISSYLVANDETWRRGVVLSFASALLQALVAVLLVGIAAAALGATAKTMSEAVRWIEIVSYAIIALLGARLLWVKGRGFIGALRALPGRAPQPLGAAAASSAPVQHGFATAHAHAHEQHGHASEHACCAHAHHHGEHHHAPEPSQSVRPHEHHSHSAHEHDACCAHGPEPQALAGPGGWKRGFSAVLAVGLRPCSGAVLVLVFALAQGLFWAGVAATFAMGIGTALTVAAIGLVALGAKGFAGRLARTGSGYGGLALRGVEVAAALVVLAFGVLLLTGYLAQERLFTS